MADQQSESTTPQVAPAPPAQDAVVQRAPTQLKRTRPHVQLKRGLQMLSFDESAALLDPNPVQRHGGKGPSTDQVHEAAAHGIAGGGGAMPHSDRIQQSFGGHDISGIKAHTGSAAKQANQAMGAEAYATGSNIAFASQPDLHTAAHEAAHVIQQQHGVSLAGGVGKAGDSYENHADKVADAVVSGQSAEPILNQMTGGGPKGGTQKKTQQKEAVQQTTTSTNDGGMTTPAAAPPIGTNIEVDVKRYCQPDPIATQKLADVDAEAHMQDVPAATAKTGFYRGVGEYINANHATLQPSTVYNACFNNKAAPYKMKGKKIDPATVGGLASRTAGVGGFWNRQIKQENFFRLAAAELGLPESDPDVQAQGRAKFIAKAKAGDDLMGDLNTGAMLAPAPYPAWFTPDKVRIDANNDTAFGDLMRIFALQPEWFSEGNVVFEVDPTVGPRGGAQELRKPTAYDGMQSSLWVARNQPADTFGMTGGGAREYLAQNVPVSAIKSCRGVVPSNDFLAQVTRFQARAVTKFLEANPQIKAELDALERQVASLPDTDPAKATAQARIQEIKNWTPNLTDWVLRGQTTFLTSHIGTKIRDAKAALDSVNTSTVEQRNNPTPTPTSQTLVNPAPPGR